MKESASLSPIHQSEHLLGGHYMPGHRPRCISWLLSSVHAFIHSFIHSFHKHLPSTRTHAWTCPTWAQHVSKRVLALLSAACSQEALGVEGRNENINTQRRTRLPRAGRDRRRRRGSHSCKRRPPDEGVPASVKMPLPCAPASFVLGCQATPQPPGRAPLPT